MIGGKERLHTTHTKIKRFIMFKYINSYPLKENISTKKLSFERKLFL